MTDEKFIKKFVRDAEFLLEDVEKDVKIEIGGTINGIEVGYSSKTFDRASRLLKEINASSTKISVKVLDSKKKYFSIRRKS